MAIEINSNNISELEASESLLVIDFGAEWCGPCRTIAPIIEELSAEYEGKANICKCDVEENDPISTKYGVRNLPTILFIKGGKVVDKHVGSISKVDLTAKIDSYI
ncbi:MAG: thioredoxin [Rikenellaceae bacterium]